MKRCIFHYPHPIVDKPGIGSALRPNKMRAAFENIGYQVDEVTGYSGERKKKIDEIKRNIAKGVKYDFLYSESVNSPTILTDEDHFPRHPLLDFSFLGFCRKQGIPVGLFYRDVHWKFPVYKTVSIWKRMILLPLFQYDLHMYHKTVDVLYLPSEKMAEVVPGYNSLPLPPGGVRHDDQLEARMVKKQCPGTLQILYVGNVLGVYNVQKLCAAVKETEGVNLTICTPESSWNAVAAQYEPVLCDRIQVIHKNSHELLPYYEAADIFACCLETNEYVRLAMPIKVPESIGYGTPILITDGIAAAELVSREGCGWVVEYTTEAIKEQLRDLLEHPQKVERAARNTVAIAPMHTWESRARQVANDLTNLKK